MKILVRGITPEEAQLYGKCSRCKSILRAEQNEVWNDMDYLTEITNCPVCNGEIIVKMYLETEPIGDGLKREATAIRQSTPAEGGGYT